MVESTSQHLYLKDLVFLMHHFLTCNHNIDSMSLKLSIHVDNTNNSSKNAVLKGKLFPYKKLIQEQKRLTTLSKPQHEDVGRGKKKDLTSRTRAQQVLFNTLYISLFSAKQQRESTKLWVFWKRDSGSKLLKFLLGTKWRSHKLCWIWFVEL